MNDFPRDKVVAAYQQVPQAIRDAFNAEATTQVALDLKAKHGLHIDQAGALGREVGYLLLGLTHPEQFMQRLTAAGIPRDVVDDVVKEVNDKIFSPLRAQMRKVEGGQSLPTMSPKPAAPNYAPPRPKTPPAEAAAQTPLRPTPPPARGGYPIAAPQPPAPRLPLPNTRSTPPAPPAPSEMPSATPTPPPVPQPLAPPMGAGLPPKAALPRRDFSAATPAQTPAAPPPLRPTPAPPPNLPGAPTQPPKAPRSSSDPYREPIE